MFALPFIRRRGKGGAGSIPPGTYATLQDVSDAISQLIGGAPDVTLDTIAEIAARIIQDESSLAAVSAAIANKQDKNAKLTALSALALAADKLIYATGATTVATSDLTAFMRSVLAAQDAAGARAAIGAVGQQAYDTDKTATATAIAGKQTASPALEAVAAGYTGGANQVAAPGASVPAFTWSAGGGYQLSPITFTAYGRNLATIANPAVRSIPVTIDAAGGVSAVQMGQGGYDLLRQMDRPASNGVFLPYITSSGAFDRKYAGTFGQNTLALNTPSTGAIVYAKDANGAADTITSTTFTRTFIGAASAQAARALMGAKAAVVSNFNNNTPIPTNGSPVELLWTTNGTLEGFDAAGVALTANPGRVTTAQTTSLALRPTLSLYASAPGDFFVTLELRDTTGATIGNENGAPSQGTGAGWKTTNVPFRVGAAGYWSVDLPDIPLKAGGNFAQLRVYITRPADATAVSVSEYQLKMVQQA